jgi:hypothetical protein
MGNKACQSSASFRFANRFRVKPEPCRARKQNGCNTLSKNRKSEFEVPPHTKVRIVATIDRKLCEEIELIHDKEVKGAKNMDRSEPDWSNTIEMLLRKGVKAYKSSSTS